MSKDRSNSCYDWHSDLHVGRDWSTVSPPAARCGESSHSPFTGGSKDKHPCSSAARNIMHLWRYICAVLWLVVCVGTCDLAPRGWTEDGAIGPAQFVVFCSGRPHRQQQALPEPKQQQTAVAADCACPRDTLARGYHHHPSSIIDDRLGCCGTSTPSCAYRRMSPRVCRQGLSFACRQFWCIASLSPFCYFSTWKRCWLQCGTHTLSPSRPAARYETTQKRRDPRRKDIGRRK